MAFVLAAICLAETMPDSAGKPHPEYLGLQIGGDGSARLEHIGHLGFLFQCLLLVKLIFYLYWAFRRDTELNDF